MNSRLGEMIARGYNALLAEREAQKRDQEARDAKILAEIETEWGQVMDAARGLLPEFLHPYLRTSRNWPYDRPGSWPRVIIDVPELVPIYMSFSSSLVLNGFHVWSNIYVDSKGEKFKAKVNASNTENTPDLNRALGLAFEQMQVLMAKELEAEELNRQHEQYLQELEVRESVAEQPAKEVSPLKRIAAALELIAAG